MDEDSLRTWLNAHGGEVSGFAVAAQFATRNPPAHERRVAEVIHDATGLPISASHHLSAKLNGPKRAITAILNARLIGMINRLITRAQIRLGELGVHAPLMVVRGDGALISADFALERPIETILSGPAASIVGARWMTGGASDALVSDIGGTTTDVAVLRDGRPAIDPPEGARVGPFRTMVEAVAMRTTGLGGDSELHFKAAGGLAGGLHLGPRRVLPVSLVATQAPPDLVHDVLDHQLRTGGVWDENHARFVQAVPGGLARHGGVSGRDLAVLDRIGGEDVRPLGGAVLTTRLDRLALARLVDRGLVQVSGVTPPSDAAHALGLSDSWDAEASRKALDLFALQRTGGAGQRMANSAEEMAHKVIDQLTDQTAVALLETAFAEEVEGSFDLPPEELARHVLTWRGLSGHRGGILRLEAGGLNLPVIGLGASAPTYYPAVGERLHCAMELPEHAGVANAIGAVVGRVTIRHSGSVTSPSNGGVYRVHLEEGGPEDFPALDPALDRLETALRALAEDEARMAGGAEGIRVHADRDIRMTVIEGGAEMFIDARVDVEAAGRPRIAH